MVLWFLYSWHAVKYRSPKGQSSLLQVCVCDFSLMELHEEKAKLCENDKYCDRHVLLREVGIHV